MMNWFGRKETSFRMLLSQLLKRGAISFLNTSSSHSSSSQSDSIPWKRRVLKKQVNNNNFWLKYLAGSNPAMTPPSCLFSTARGGIILDTPDDLWTLSYQGIFFGIQWLTFSWLEPSSSFSLPSPPLLWQSQAEAYILHCRPQPRKGWKKAATNKMTRMTKTINKPKNWSK